MCGNAPVAEGAAEGDGSFSVPALAGRGSETTRLRAALVSGRVAAGPRR